MSDDKTYTKADVDTAIAAAEGLGRRTGNCWPVKDARTSCAQPRRSSRKT